MSYFKLGAISLLIASTGALAANTNQEPSQAELDALRSTHAQFEALELDGESAYKKSKEYLDGISTSPKDIKYPGNVVFTKEDAKLFRESHKQALELGLVEKERPEWIDSSAGQWDQTVKEISGNAEGLVEKRIRMAYPDVSKKEVEVIRGNDPKNGFLSADEDLYLFITSAMRPSEISDVLVAAKNTGATVVLRGMLPNTSALTDTSRYLLKIIQEAKLEKSPPKIIIDPRLFNIFNIQSAPAMAYNRKAVSVTGHGLVAVDWFVEQGRTRASSESLGQLSATVDIVEEDLLALLQRKYQEIDWKKQRRKAISSFFARQTFEPFPVPKEDKDFELDPRIVFTKDVYSGGKLLAKKGDVVNPLAGFEGMNRSLFIIDPRDPRQRSLVKDRLYKDSVGNPTIVVSHLDAQKQFKGIAELEREFEHKIYMLQPSYIERFRLSALPVRVDLVGGKGIWIKEYGAETLNNIHEKLEGTNK
ncbi:hypothetical protein FWP33_08930 [Vibrio parahaemolyticus]|jgi:hypothetical protein|uniref:Conjugal transfer protein n=2 Tax=Vibrio harveyi group TaxID=717610 RepID=A0A9Q3UAP3_VIBPH|nr:TrbC family F-type conjugative pilus assembly protein [Vibrio parahaemolyticus]ELA8176677.1 hypothetical protein [Vibrio alginolyticus]CAH1598730.1 conserved exported hypothetical protein [Vibrio jasicida]EGQ9742642.1 hypothetical protein [Vibrio parahaemolyticus]EJC7176116.1 hypothetical protein [Vibrio parahaemolyticus]EJE4724555.1 hypothetical protein [Vibrio parahaemolyticus]